MNSVSVAMAVYNGERFIKEQIDSILCQLREKDEIVISYDVSSDNTWKILEEYHKKDPRIKLYRNEKKGITNNFNNAIDNCSGDYIFIADQDDIWHPDKIETVLAAFKKTYADVIVHNVVSIDELKNIISESAFKIHNIKPGALKNFLKPRYSGCCTAFRSAFKHKLIPIPEIYAYDHWIGVTGEIFGNLHFIDDILLYHRIHDRNATPKTKRPLYLIIWCRLLLLINLAVRFLRLNIHGKNLI